jgi:hypothetical protein
MAPKRKGSRDPLIIVLEEHEFSVGPTRWLRVTRSRDERNSRECYCVNFYSGSPTDSPAVSESISGSKRINLNTTDGEFRLSGLEMNAFIRLRIVQAVQRHSGQPTHFLMLIACPYCYSSVFSSGAIESPRNMMCPRDSHPPADLTASIVAESDGQVSPSNPMLAYRVAITAEAERRRASRVEELDLLDAAFSLPIGVVEQAEDALLRTIHTNAALDQERAAGLREMRTAIRDAGRAIHPDHPAIILPATGPQSSDAASG